MARKLRVEHPGGIHHVINRSDRREPIFKGDPDRILFLETVGEGILGWHSRGLFVKHNG